MDSAASSRATELGSIRDEIEVAQRRAAELECDIVRHVSAGAARSNLASEGVLGSCGDTSGEKAAVGVHREGCPATPS